MRKWIYLLLALPCILGPVSQGRAGEILRKKLIIISVDGTRPDALLAADAPVLDSLFVGSAYTYRGQTAVGAADLPISGSSYSSMLTGVWCAKHGVCENDFTNSHFNLYPIFFCRLKAVFPAIVIQSIVRWGPLSPNLIACADVNLAPASDSKAADEAVRLLSTTDPDVFFFHLEDVDTAGHSCGFSPTAQCYLDAIHTADGRLGRALDAIRARSTYSQEDWLIIALTDHGGEGKDHHAKVPNCMTIFMTLQGSRALPGEMDPPPEVVDVAATAMTFFGLPIDPAWGLDGHAVGLRVEEPPPRQRPGDCNQDLALDISDVACLIGHLFSREPVVFPCGEEAPGGGNAALLDSNGDAEVDVSDAVYLLFNIFAAGPPPALGAGCAPMPGCPDICSG